MLPFLGLFRDVLVLGAVLVVVIAAAHLNPWVAQNSPPATVEEEAATSVPPVVEEHEVAVAVDEEPEPVPPPKPAPRPEKPVVETPKAETPTITLDDAIQSINNLAAGQAAGSVNERVRAALVNIICTTDASGPFSSVSGSGVIIDPRGVILTNAHVAQFFLLKDYPTKDFVDCIVRTGSPAKPMYKAELMFLPPSWIRDNARKITEEAPSGNGERDYALLRISGGVSQFVTLPSSFPFLLVSLDEPKIGDDMLQAGYAAGFLGGITIQNDLYASSAWTKVRDIYTFNANTIDLFSLGGSIVAQSGSSGGPAANADGILMGIITTNSGTGDTSSRDLHALSTSYIVRDFEFERGKSLVNVLSTDNLAAEVAIYNQVFAPSARAALIAEIEK